MADHEHPSKKKRSKRNWMCYLLIIVSVLFVAWPFITWGILGIADRLFEGINFPETSRFGISGDMYGALNALFAGLAFVGFIYALRQQSLELQLQRRELSLQRRVLDAQCREQKRQANEFEIQNKLMKIQQFESFFYQQIVFIKSIHKEVREILKIPSQGIDLVGDVIYFFDDIKNNIIKLKSWKNCKNEILSSNDVLNIYQTGDYIKKMRSWIDSTYNFILMIINENCLNEKQKEKYLYIIKNMFPEEDWKVMYFLGAILKYNEIKNYLLNKGLFERNDLIERVSEDDMQFLQNEMKLKSNPSLESCEITL